MFEMLSYSSSCGAFAGISFEGSTLRPDADANRRLYGKDAAAFKIITEPNIGTHAAGKALVARLQKRALRSGLNQPVSTQFRRRD